MWMVVKLALSLNVTRALRHTHRRQEDTHVWLIYVFSLPHWSSPKILNPLIKQTCNANSFLKMKMWSNKSMAQFWRQNDAGWSKAERETYVISVTHIHMCIHTDTHAYTLISCWEAAQASCGDQTAALTYHLSLPHQTNSSLGPLMSM